MTYLKIVATVVVIVLALYGGLKLSQSAGHLYDDWAFVRASRVQAIQRAQQQQQQQKSVPQKPQN